MSRRPTSLGYAIPALVLSSIAVPIALVLIMTLLAKTGRTSLESTVVTTADAAARFNNDDAELDRLAMESGARVTVYVGTLLRFDADGSRPQANELGIPSLGGGRALPRPRAPLSEERVAEVQRLAAQDPASLDECRITPGQTFVRCTSTRLVGENVLVVERTATRGVTRLFDASLFGWLRPLVVFALFAFLLGILGAWTLVRRIRRPLQALHDQVTDRKFASDPRPIQIQASPEIDAVAGAFNDLLAQLRVAQRRRADFVDGVAHEVKTPLAVIRTNTERLRSNEARSDGEGEILSSTERALARIESTVRALLELSRIEEGIPERSKEDFDLGELVTNVVASMDEAGNKVSCTVCPAPFRGAGDELGRLVRALVENALLYGKGECAVSLAEDAGSYILEVRDDGPGVDKGQEQEVFERFMTGRDGGSGIGLALVRAVAHAHGGDAWTLAGDGGRFYASFSASSHEVHTESTDVTQG